MSSSKLSKQLKTIIQSWPTDPLRPNIQLKNFLTYLSDHPGLTSQAVQVAKAIQDNELQKQYPLSDKMLRPASRPHHYTRLVEAVQKSSEGVGRPWWKVFFGIW